MNYSYEYLQFLREKMLEYMPSTFIQIGDKCNGRCPFCGDSRKSSSKKRGWIYLNTASYYCFNCGISMSGIKFLEAMSGKNYKDIKIEYTKLFLKSGLNNNLSSDILQPNNNLSIFNLKPIVNNKWKNKLSEKAYVYLKNRQVLNAPFLKEKLYSYIDKNNNEYILIPWILNGCEAYYQVNDFQKNHSMKYIFPKNKKKLLYGLDNIDLSWKYIIVTEGVYDSLFIKNGISCGTKSITDYQVSLIKERYPNHQIVISFDNDQAGIDSMISMINKKNDFKFFKWFNKNTIEKDINDYVISKNNVNMFIDSKILEKLIVNKLFMKMQLIKDGFWKNKNNLFDEITYDKSQFWKKRKIF